MYNDRSPSTICFAKLLIFNELAISRSRDLLNELATTHTQKAKCVLTNSQLFAGSMIM